ncbi:hypothetical protein HZQ28_07840 [Elizabethkingia anophelis]|nr:hypothetical protein [Elizabethkingia anophelis]MCT3994395.1 hypothetical protein [Elizabethkingia anophelis]MCT3997885.1 hypothetical protein [Elizabethkingia anophelis]MCT4254930.1 hypothetical protein [Elizabethkingia anophelis]
MKKIIILSLILLLMNSCDRGYDLQPEVPTYNREKIITEGIINKKATTKISDTIKDENLLKKRLDSLRKRTPENDPPVKDKNHWIFN